MTTLVKINKQAITNKNNNNNINNNNNKNIEEATP